MPQGPVTIRRRTVVPAGGAVGNVLSDDPNEYIDRLSRVQVAILESGATQRNVLADVQFATDLAMERAPLNYEAGGRLRINEDVMLESVAGPGDRLTVRLTNPDAAGTAQVETLVAITPLV